MYRSMYQDSKPFDWTGGGKKKVDTICSKMLQVLEEDLDNNFLPVLSCLVRNSESKNEAALLKIQTMRGCSFVPKKKVLRKQKWPPK